VAADGGERGRNWHGHTRATSIYTRAALRPSALALAATGLVGLLLMANRKRSFLSPSQG
jgi:hypothetical protein